MLTQSLVQVPVKYVSVQCRGGLITVLYGKFNYQARIAIVIEFHTHSTQ